MKTHPYIKAILACGMAVLAPSTFAQLSVQSDGSDGALNIASNTVIDLSLAATGTWSNAASGNGIYDPVQWPWSSNIPA